MSLRISSILGICIFMMQLLQFHCQLEIDPEVRSQLEDRVISSMSLKKLEEMVEQDERVLNTPRQFIIITNPRDGLPADMEQRAYLIQRKTKKYPKKAITKRMSYGLFDGNDGFKKPSFEPRSSYEPRYKFESSFKYDEESPSLYGLADMVSAGSNPVKSFHETLAERVWRDFRLSQLESAKDPFGALEAAASEVVSSYKPRLGQSVYSRDLMASNLEETSRRMEDPERRDEKGCKTVVKKIKDPKYDEKSDRGIIITKECEYPNIDGPDAKVSDIRDDSSSRDSDSSDDFDSEAPAYQSSRPVELEMEPIKARDPLAPDYIDTMLDSHFRSFPGFRNPLTSFKGYQDRFNLSPPSTFKEIKPTVKFQSYDYSNPQSGFSQRESLFSKDDVPKAYESQRDFDQPEEKTEGDYSDSKVATPKVHEHHYHYDYPERNIKKASNDGEKRPQGESKYAEKKDPKMIKKSFAYYRKDNPKEDPNDQHYAEEFAQGNFRSFSSNYDSERDGPKKPEQ